MAEHTIKYLKTKSLRGQFKQIQVKENKWGATSGQNNPIILPSRIPFEYQQET